MEGFDLSFVPALYKPSSLLPIAKHRESLLYTVEKFPVTVVVGQTGSGKTTQLPQFLEQAGWCADGKVIGVTQVGSLDLQTLRDKQASNFLYSRDG
jgi:ATP-dependent RNA helicase DDX35